MDLVFIDQDNDVFSNHSIDKVGQKDDSKIFALP